MNISFYQKEDVSKLALTWALKVLQAATEFRTASLNYRHLKTTICKDELNIADTANAANGKRSPCTGGDELWERES